MKYILLSILIAIAVLNALPLILRLIKWVKARKNECFEIVKRSNIVQYDDFGNPLRLCIVKVSKDPKVPLDQMWIDSYDEKGDIECVWRKKQ